MITRMELPRDIINLKLRKLLEVKISGRLQILLSFEKQLIIQL